MQTPTSPDTLSAERRINDPLGNALKDYAMYMQDACLDVYSDVSEDDVIPVPYFFRGYDEMPQSEQLALSKCEGRVLDIGAGAGSHALWLQTRGFEVCGLDFSPGAVEVMQYRGLKNTFCQDFFLLDPTPFETLLMLMNGIGICGKPDGLDRFLLKAKTFLTPTGQILLDSSDLSYMFQDECEPLVGDGDAYYGVVQYQMGYRGALTKWFHWLFIDAELLNAYANRAGFQTEILYKDHSHQYLARLTLK